MHPDRQSNMFRPVPAGVVDCPKPPREPEVTRQLQANICAITELETRLGLLVERLRPVINPNTGAPPSPEKSAPCPSTPLVATLYEQQRRLEVLIEQVGTVTSALEI